MYFDRATAIRIVSAIVLILAVTQQAYGEALVFAVGSLVVLALNRHEFFA
jgi:hypothetical protein